MRMRKSALWLGVSFGLACGMSCGMASGALGLSESRVYEMVTPVFKGGYGANIAAASPDGERVSFGSLGSFAGIVFPNAGAVYLASRDQSGGWATVAVEPPFPPPRGVADFSADVEYTLGDVSDPRGSGASKFMLHLNSQPDLPEFWSLFGGKIFDESISEEDASGDLCHVAMSAGPDLLPEPGRDPAVDVTIYDLARDCGGGAGSLKQVAVSNGTGPEGEPEPLAPTCVAELGVGVGATGYASEQPASFNEMSGDGSELFFTVGRPSGTSQCTHPQLFMRVGGSRTVEVSRPVEADKPFGGCGEGVGEVPGEVPCQGSTERDGAFFKGAAEDGSRVFFTSTAPLVPGDVDLSNKLYLASIGCPGGEPDCVPAQRRVTSLVDASRSEIPGEEAEVRGVLSVGRQAGRVYFMAHGVLTEAPNMEGETAKKGAENLYVYDSASGGVAFVAELCSGGLKSGDVVDTRCPLSGSSDETLWGEGLGGAEAQSADDGRYLVFSTYARLAGRGLGVDTDNARDVYRYDAQSGALDRVSAGEVGHDANGNGEFGAAIDLVGVNPGGRFEAVHFTQEMSTRAVSEDGSTVVFLSAEPLSATAVNGQDNVYVWHEQAGEAEGRVSIVSSGSSPLGDGQQVLDLTGRDVFFVTAVGLLPQDTEGDTDVYDARLGGGFPEPAAQRVQCSSDACQGPLSAPAPTLIAGGTATQTPGDNYPPAKKGPSVKRKSKVKKGGGTKAKRKASRARRRRRGGKVLRSSRTAGKTGSGRGARR